MIKRSKSSYEFGLGYGLAFDASISDAVQKAKQIVSEFVHNRIEEYEALKQLKALGLTEAIFREFVNEIKSHL